jgi:hypothetical protein
MVKRVSIVGITSKPEKKEYFSSKYSFSKVTKMKKGDEVYAVFLKPDSYILQSAGHRLNPKVKGKEGFKNNIYGCTIKCHKYDSDGERIAQKAACCDYSNNEATKKLLGWENTKYYIPLMILGSSETDKNITKITPAKLTIKQGYEPTYLEMSKRTFMK